MPKEAKYSVAVSAFERLAVESHNSVDNSGQGMPVNTRSMQRLSSTPQGSSSQMRPGGTPQYSISRNAMSTTGASNDNVESSDEDTEDEDDSGEEEDDADNGNNEGSDAESDDSGDEDDPASRVQDIFAIAEPSGLVPYEPTQTGVNEVSSRAYRGLIDVVAGEAACNERFFDALTAVVRVPSREWSLLMYFQLRNRLETAMMRFDQNPRTHDAINTATRLKSLLGAINSMIQDDNWQVMDQMTKQQYFGLLLDLLRGVVDRNSHGHSDRARHSQSSRSGTPYVTETGRDIDLYEQMKDTPSVLLLQRMFNSLGPHGLDARQKEHITSLLVAVEQRCRLSGTVVSDKSPDPSQILVAHLRKMHHLITPQMPASSSSRGSRSSRAS